MMNQPIHFTFSVENKAFMSKDLDGLKWEDFHYPKDVTIEEKVEIDKVANYIIGEPVTMGNNFYKLSGSYKSIMGQENIDRQVKAIRNSGIPCGLIWFIKAIRIIEGKEKIDSEIGLDDDIINGCDHYGSLSND